MDLPRLVETTRSRSYRILDSEELELLRTAATPAREIEATLDHKIEVFTAGETFLVLERSDKDEWILRAMDSDFAVDGFIKNRVDTYDRMWDGCGCKVNYYE